jgi:hypothetical protein
MFSGDRTKRLGTRAETRPRGSRKIRAENNYRTAMEMREPVGELGVRDRRERQDPVAQKSDRSTRRRLTRATSSWEKNHWRGDQTQSHRTGAPTTPGSASEKRNGRAALGRTGFSHHNQTEELITYFLNLPLDESIDNKSTKFEVQIQDPMKHS